MQGGRIRSTKYEIRSVGPAQPDNPKQIQMTNEEMAKTKARSRTTSF
jgi:hypothetical protein